MAKRIKRYIAYVDALLERDDIDVKKEMAYTLDSAGSVCGADGHHMHSICCDSKYFTPHPGAGIHGSSRTIHQALSPPGEQRPVYV